LQNEIPRIETNLSLFALNGGQVVTLNGVKGLRDSSLYSEGQREFLRQNIVHVLRELGSTFVPLLVAMDSMGNLPIFLSLTQGIEVTQRRRTVRLATFTALGVGLGFVAIGKAVFLLLSIEVADFLVAGGIILLVLAIKYLITGKIVETQDSSASEMVGAVPLGTPLDCRAGGAYYFATAY